MSALLLFAGPRVAAALVLDFEGLDEGARVHDADLPPGFVMTVRNNTLGHPNAAIVFDSSCSNGCSGNDPDLRTPGLGAGNDAAQGRVMIIAQQVIDANPADGLVDNPDDEGNGGSIRFFFDSPVAVASLRVIDVDLSETTGFVQLALADGGFVTQPLAPLGDNSAQTVVFEGAPLANSLRIVLAGSGAVDDITFETTATTIPPTSSSLPGTTTTITTTQTSTTSTTTTTIGGSCGDANDDGRVTATDASQVLRSAINALVACPARVCDVNANGVVDTSDALGILRLAVGIFDDSVCAEPVVVAFTQVEPIALTALQWEVDYSDVPGVFAGEGDDVECTVLVDLGSADESLRAFHNASEERVLRAGLISLEGWQGPADVAECVFLHHGPPAPLNFQITTTDAASLTEIHIGGVTVVASER